MEAFGGGDIYKNSRIQRWNKTTWGQVQGISNEETEIGCVWQWMEHGISGRIAWDQTRFPHLIFLSICSRLFTNKQTNEQKNSPQSDLRIQNIGDLFIHQTEQGLVDLLKMQLYAGTQIISQGPRHFSFSFSKSKFF